MRRFLRGVCFAAFPEGFSENRKVAIEKAPF